MSLVAASSGMKPYWAYMAAEPYESPWILVSSSVISVIVMIVLMRSVVSFFMDVSKVVRRMMVTQYKETGIQTEPYYVSLPDEIFINPKSQVYHVSGCHHVGVRAESKVACCLCKNTF